MAKHFQPIVRSQDQLVEEIKAILRDPGQDRWEDSEIVLAINRALMQWSGRVTVSFIYDIVGGLQSNVQEYAVPDYITGPLDVQRKSIRYWEGNYLIDDSQYVWTSVNGWSLERAADGDGQLLRLAVSTYRYTQHDEELRIVWQAENGPLPTDVLSLKAGIGASDTEITIDDNPYIPHFGYVRINHEWMQYSGLSVDSTGVVTLSDLVRGTNSSAATTHATGDSIQFGIMVPDPRLFDQLINQSLSYLNSLYITESSATETSHYQWSMRWYQQLADDFWKSYAPNVDVRLVLTRQAMGGWIQ